MIVHLVVDINNVCQSIDAPGDQTALNPVPRIRCSVGSQKTLCSKLPTVPDSESCACGSKARAALIRFIMAVVMGNRILVDPFPALTRLMPLIMRLTYGVWNDGAMQVGSASRRKNLRSA